MENISSKLISWYHKNKRDLPWRNTTDPYKIWLSEIILQQTRVAQGLPYYLKFTEKYPTVETLAKASEQEVLRLWQGLGYYSRARNMHAAAKYIVTNLEGKFPEKFTEIKKLKGVGDYTAAAIASFAFKEKVAVVDGNVYRVLARIFGIDKDINSNDGKKEFAKTAALLIPEDEPDTYNQAIMEFGALHCTPANPNCLFCPFTQACVARLTQKQDKLPVKIKKLKTKKRFFHYIVVEHQDQLLMKERQAGDIWQGLFDFPIIEATETIDESAVIEQLQSNYIKEFEVQSISKEFKHILTHQHIYAKFFLIKTQKEKQLKSFIAHYGAKLYNQEKIEEIPKPVLVSKYLKEYIF
ncbi:A/G-specific adenine glycosylase [Chondrinema litorale]|uniref:A/G-specific adenine glycosylase n=1 Tax=Chondrinema litorale TaxID=2994555 RepID=UPI002542A88C|nr:A/G-specific adenine glycosylase [Chondrinema litorale]UZR95837.1 A/G-specific adenine glycosylase [Chondrinema litorale]